MEYVKKFRTSGLSLRRFTMMHGVNRETLRDWIYAYQDLEGKFIRLDFDGDGAGGRRLKYTLPVNPRAFIKKQDTVFKITTKENIVFIATVYTWFEVDNDAPEANSDSLDFYQNVCFLVKKVLSSNLINSVIKEGAYITYSQFDFPSKIEVYK